MLMNMPGGRRRDHCIQSPPESYQNPHKDVSVVVWPVAVAGAMVRLVVVATGHLSPATARCQCGQSVDRDRGPGPGEPTLHWPMYGRDNVGCAVVPWW